MKQLSTFSDRLQSDDKTDFEKVKLFYAGLLNEDELNERILHKIDIWKDAYSKLLDPNFSDHEIAKYLIRRFPNEFSLSTSYRHIAIAKRIFEYNNTASRDFDLTFIKMNQKKALAMAYTNNDPGAAIKVLREMRLTLGEQHDSSYDMILMYLEEKKTIKFTVDPKDVGLKKYSPKEVDQLIDKFISTIQDDIIDIPHEDAEEKE